jgi:rhodanese-related sulfurtransferase
MATPVAGLQGRIRCEAMEGDLSPIQVDEMLARGEAQLIDVRERHEHEAAWIAGDRLIELVDLAAQAATIASDRPVVLYCHSGGRSAWAASALRASGFDAHNLEGGIVAWAAAGLPIEPDGARVSP